MPSSLSGNLHNNCHVNEFIASAQIKNDAHLFLKRWASFVEEMPTIYARDGHHLPKRCPSFMQEMGIIYRRDAHHLCKRCPSLINFFPRKDPVITQTKPVTLRERFPATEGSPSWLGDASRLGNGAQHDKIVFHYSRLLHSYIVGWAMHWVYRNLSKWVVT